MISCISYGQDICIANKHGLKANLTVYIGISGGKDLDAISFDLQASLAEELVLENAKPMRIYMQKGDTKILRYYVPDDANITHITISSRSSSVFDKF